MNSHDNVSFDDGVWFSFEKGKPLVLMNPQLANKIAIKSSNCIRNASPKNTHTFAIRQRGHQNEHLNGIFELVWWTRFATNFNENDKQIDPEGQIKAVI